LPAASLDPDQGEHAAVNGAGEPLLDPHFGLRDALNQRNHVVIMPMNP
jgi:hypothetical protein